MFYLFLSLYIHHALMNLASLLILCLNFTDIHHHCFQTNFISLILFSFVLICCFRLLCQEFGDLHLTQAQPLQLLFYNYSPAHQLWYFTPYSGSFYLKRYNMIPDHEDLLLSMSFWTFVHEKAQQRSHHWPHLINL